MQTEEEIAQSETEKIKSISIIWLIPLLALLIGAWMVFVQLSNQGDLVTITFKDAKGLEAGKTTIKVKNVQVGVVKKIELNDHLNGVVVTARVHNKDDDLLVTGSEFWVVRPKIGKGGITGLSTLVSGAYIELSPGNSKTIKYTFTGLENEPLTSSGTPGLHITLSTNGEHALQIGDVILFHGIKAGRIEYVYFNAEERTVYYDAFIESPYDKLITTNTKFWAIRGIEVNLSAEGVQIESGTLETLISGGVTFDVPPGVPDGKVVTQRKVFKVFPNKSAINDSLYGQGMQFILLFKDSIRGLKPGAPVEFRGIKIGRVSRTDLTYPKTGHLLDPDSSVPVMITIEPKRIGYKNNNKDMKQAKEDIFNLLKKGLYGRLVTGSYLTGKKYITLQYEKNLQQTVQYFNGYTVIPVQSDQLDKLVRHFSRLIEKINRLPLKTVANTTTITLQQLTETLKDIGQTSRQMQPLLKHANDENLVGNINAVLTNIKKLTVDFSSGSPTNEALINTLGAMQDALTELKPLLIQLNQNPSSIIFGNQKTQDIEPEGRQQ